MIDPTEMQTFGPIPAIRLASIVDEACDRFECDGSTTEPLDHFYWHEALDRAHTLSTMFTALIDEHPVVESIREIHEQAMIASEALADLYQLIGQHAPHMKESDEGTNEAADYQEAKRKVWEVQLQLYPNSVELQLPTMYNWADSAKTLDERTRRWSQLALALQYPVHLFYITNPNSGWVGLRYGVRGHEYVSGFNMGVPMMLVDGRYLQAEA